VDDGIVNQGESSRGRLSGRAEVSDRVRTEPTRHFFDVASGQRLSALVWGTGEPEAVMLHGRGQNAHTWDAVARRLAIPLLAIDLPGHGYSDWRDDHDYGPVPNAPAVASVIQQAARNAKVVVGMSLGGGTTIRLASTYPELVRRAVVVDSTPANRQGRAPLTAQQRGALTLLDGPTFFGSFDEMLHAAAAAVPSRPVESLRRGVLNNSRQLDDGRWTWRYDTQRPEGVVGTVDRSALWNDVAAIAVPVMLVRAGRSGLVLDEDVDEFVRRQPRTRVELVADAGHSVQSDQPDQLAFLIQDFVATTS
jgi:esterase